VSEIPARGARRIRQPVQSRHREPERLGHARQANGAPREADHRQPELFELVAARLARAKQSGLSFEALTVHIDGDDWQATKHDGEFQPSAGKVPVLWDGDVVVWDSLAILEYLADKVGRDRFWPKDDAARGMARAMVAEMHSSYLALRRLCPMNIRSASRVRADRRGARRHRPHPRPVGRGARALRQGRAVPVRHLQRGRRVLRPGVTRFVTYGIGVPGFAQSTCRRSGSTTGCRNGSSGRGRAVGDRAVRDA
jgi:glutathione S-transferase